MRVFLAASFPLLARWWSAGSVTADSAFAVTPALQDRYGTDDTEELEYVALIEAARSSLALLAADPSAPRRRIVVAADAPDALPDTRRGPAAAVRLSGQLPIRAVVSVHADDVAAVPSVQAAVAAVARSAAAPGVAVAAGGEYEVAGVETLDLLWYATQEIPDLLATS